MITALIWCGGVAGALAAIGTVLRWTVRRLVRVGLWVATVATLPDVVGRLALAVDQLTERVNELHPPDPAPSVLEPL